MIVEGGGVEDMDRRESNQRRDRASGFDDADDWTFVEEGGGFAEESDGGCIEKVMSGVQDMDRCGYAGS